MVSDNIYILIEKYLEGNTTLKEEVLLKHYFTSDKVASHLELYKPLFQYFSTQQVTDKAKLPRLKTNISRRLWYSSIAAAMVLFVGLYAWQNYQQRQYAKQVYQESQEAFALISKYLNKGHQAIYRLNHLEQSGAVVFRSHKNEY